MEVQGDSVPQARNQHAELPFVQIDAADLVAVRENNKRLERICGHQRERTAVTFIFKGKATVTKPLGRVNSPVTPHSRAKPGDST